MKNIKFFFWKIINRKEYRKKITDRFIIQVDFMNKQEAFRLKIMEYVKKHKKIPPKYTLQYMAMKKIKISWYEDRKIIKKMKKTAKRIVRNEYMNKKNIERQLKKNDTED